MGVLTNFVIRNQTPQHVELHGVDDADILKLSPLQVRRLGSHPTRLYGDAATAARQDQAVDWEPEPTRSMIVRVASVFAATGMLAGLVAVGALLGRDVAAAMGVAGFATLCLLAAALAIRRARGTLLHGADRLDRELEPAREAAGFVELLRDLVISSFQYSALVVLIVVGVSAPAAALYFGTDLAQAVRFDGLRPIVIGGDVAHHVLVVRSLQLVLVILVSLVPALMYFQFDREKLTTLVDRWLHVIFRLDPTLRTIADVDAKYGRRVEEFLGASLGLGVDTTRQRLRDRSPVVLSTLLIAIGWIVVVLSVPTNGPDGAPATVPEMFHPQLTPVTMAFLGAYFLSVQVALRGFVRGDLKPKTYNVITVRILMAVVLAWSVQGIIGDGPSTLAVSFLAGVVPNTVLLSIRTLTGSKATTDDELDRRSPLTQIDEIDVYERTRLEEEGITSVQALARHDLVDLMLSSRIPAPRLIDWVDQAMLQQHTTAEVTMALRANGVRSATDLLQVCAHEGALAELTKALDGRCSPTLLRVVLAKDEWLTYVTNWRQHEDLHASKVVAYHADRPVGGTLDLAAHIHRQPTATSAEARQLNDTPTTGRHHVRAR